MRNRDKSFGETSFLDGFNGAIDAQSEAYGSGAAGKLNLSFSKTAIEPNVAGPSAVPATPALGAGARRKARPSILGAPEDLDDLPMPPGSAIKDVLDRSNSTIANALLHAQRVPKGEGAAKQAPVRRLNLSGS